MPDYRVLIPLDGSHVAEHSLVYLGALRRMGESQVLLLGVVDESEDFHSLSPDEAREREAQLLSTYLREVSADAEQHLGIKAETKVLSGVPASRILEEADRFSPDLLVISTHGRSGVSRWRFGSVADKVIRGAVGDTLVVGPKASEGETWMEGALKPRFKSILVPLDGSSLAEAALAKGKSFAAAFGSGVHLVRAVPIPTMTDGDVGGGAYMPNVLDQLKENAQAYLQKVASGWAPAVELNTKVGIGTPAALLEEYVREQDIDLVIMTSHGRGGIVRWALGSVTDRMLGAEAPVLIVRAGENK